LIPEYARILAVTSRPEYKSVYDRSKPVFDSLWKYRTDAPEKTAPYLKTIEADPTVNSPEVPAKAEDTPINAPTSLITSDVLKTVRSTKQSPLGPKGVTTNGKAGNKGAAPKKPKKKR